MENDNTKGAWKCTYTTGHKSPATLQNLNEWTLDYFGNPEWTEMDFKLFLLYKKCIYGAVINIWWLDHMRTYLQFLNRDYMYLQKCKLCRIKFLNEQPYYISMFLVLSIYGSECLIKTPFKYIEYISDSIVFPR